LAGERLFLAHLGLPRLWLGVGYRMIWNGFLVSSLKLAASFDAEILRGFWGV
jgi:hypothetical protein